MKKVKKDGFKLIGISMRTTNENMKAGEDIPLLWSRFMDEKIPEKIIGKTNEEVFCVYTNYESDYTKPYDVIIGCKVESLDDIPVGMVGVEMKGGTFGVFTSKGDITKGKMIYETWLEIQGAEIDRTYTNDFELYDQRSADLRNAEVDIFVALKE